jgi:hypothetical protein
MRVFDAPLRGAGQGDRMDDAHSLKARLDEYESWLGLFDAILKPIGSRQSSPEEFKKRPHPLDAGIRTEAENILAAVIELYDSTPEAREPIRKMFARCRTANWAIWPPQKPTTVDGFRTWLLRISIDDEQDRRDVMSMLGRVCCEAEDASVEIRPILESVAAISSDVERYGWGSLRQLLLMAPSHCRDWRKWGEPMAPKRDGSQKQ